MSAAVQALAFLTFAFWLGLALDRRRRWPAECRLEDRPSQGPAAGRVVAVVPARDEAEVLPSTLPSLLAQGVPPGLSDIRSSPAAVRIPEHERGWRPSRRLAVRASSGARNRSPEERAARLEGCGPGLDQGELAGLEVVLVDDRSSDGSGDLAREIAGQGGWAGQLRVVAGREPPPGWSGKVHALALGVEAACGGPPETRPEWLLLTDADIQHRPGALTALLARAQDGPYDLVSVMARLHAGSFWERLLIPPFVFFFQLLYPFRLVRDPASRVAAAAGGCVLVRRERLAAAGGLAAIRGALIDDVALARAVARAGGRLWLGFDPGIASVRPYRTLGEIWRMVARSAFVQLRTSYLLLLLTLAGLALLFVSPPVLALAAVLALATGQPMPAGLVLIPSLAAWGLATAALLPAVRHHRVPWPYALALPLASALYGLMTLTSALNHLRGRGNPWKGRSYAPRA